METKFYRYYVKTKMPNKTKIHKYCFSDTDKKRLFLACVNFASGYVQGICATNKHIPISTNCCQSIDGYIWWHTITNDIIVSIEDEKGKLIKKIEDINSED